MSERRAALTGAHSRHGGYGFPHHLTCVLGILDEYRDDLIDGYSVVLRVPAVIIGNHSDGHVANLGFTRQFGFLQVGHPDYIHTPAAVNVRFRSGRELRAFHAEVGAAALDANSGLAARAFYHLADLRTNGIGKGNVRHHAAAEEGIYPVARPVEELVRQNEIEGLVLFLK